MAQDLQTEATIQSVEFENGWYRVNTDQGEFSTKYQDRGVEAQQFVGQRVLLSYSQGDPRQGRNGQWYQSRYLSGITSPGYVAPQLQPQQGSPQGLPPQQAPGAPQQQQQVAPQRQLGEDDNTRNTRIMRQTAGKLAVWTLPLIPSEHRGFENQIAIAEAWMRYFIGGAQGVGVAVPNGQPTSQPQSVPAEPGIPAVIASQVLDDIPF